MLHVFQAHAFTFPLLDLVLSSPQILNVPLLLLANKQDSPESLSATEIRYDYEAWDQHRRDCARRRYGEDEGTEVERRRRRIASLDVMGVSALSGCVDYSLLVYFSFVEVDFHTNRQGVREVVDWLFLRVQNSRR